MKTPIFMFNKEVLKKNYKEFENLCKKYLNNFKIVYSVKTNPYEKIINTLNKLKCGFEVASLDEIMRIGKNKFVVFNSPAKIEKELKIAIKNKFLINIDSKSEIDKISKILNGKSYDIGIRIALEESKFGIEKEKIKEIIKYAESKKLNIVCMHCHLGTQLSIKKYEEGIKQFAEIIEILKINLSYIDIGGGFPDKFQLKNMNLKLEDYFNLIKKHLLKFNTTIILEPGRFLVNDSMYLLTKVIVIKENYNKKYAILDAGINLLPKITLSKYQFSKLDKEKQDKNDKYILSGPLLFSNDTLGLFQGYLQEGDILKVENIGAYCYSLTWEISYKKPKILTNI
jgi:diaminopimelate decarboxylase